MFTNHFWHLIQFSIDCDKVFKMANQLRGFHNNSSDLTVCVSKTGPYDILI